MCENIKIFAGILIKVIIFQMFSNANETSSVQATVTGHEETENNLLTPLRWTPECDPCSTTK